MKELYEYLIHNMRNGKIDKNCTIDLIRLLKKQEGNMASSTEDIAVIGMKIRLPQANTLEEYWDIITNKQDCISDFPESRKKDINSYLEQSDGKYHKDNPAKYFQSAYLTEIDKFDYKYFNITPREASVIDPAQRLFLETAWHAIEDAGYGGNKLKGTNTGVFVGFAGNVKDLYARLIADMKPQLLSLSMTGNLSAVIPSRLSYLLDLKGPSMVIDTACSSSLVALDLACQSLKEGKCDNAIVGGINLDIVPIDEPYTHIGIESTDNRSRAFDDNSDGSGIGEGVIALLLKPLKKAYEDKDYIYAIIKGSAINQDGHSQGLSAPNPASQAQVIRKAWEAAGIDPRTVTYIEAHGTGTNLGDPIEIKGINDAFRFYTEQTQFCAISSVKSNIGHLCEASGLASMVKAILALNHKKLPPSAYFNKPNTAIPFVKSPLYVNTQVRDWTKYKEEPRRCGISSFGISGTNCHVILEEALREPALIKSIPLQLFCLSAKTEIALGILVQEYLVFLNGDITLNLQDICYSANTGRGHYEYRLAIVASNTDELYNRLSLFAIEQYSVADYVYYGKNRANAPAILQSHKNFNSLPSDNVFTTYGSLKQLELLCLLAKEYVNGIDVIWDDLYKDCEIQKVPLPVYPFEAFRCWIESEGYMNKPEDDLTAMCHRPIWIKKLPDTKPELKKGSIAVFTNQEIDALTQELLNLLHSHQQAVILIQLGQSYQKISETHYIMENKEQDYFKLFSDFESQNISYILHLCALKINAAALSLEELKENQEIGAISLFYLVRAIVNYGFEQNINILLCAKYVHQIQKGYDVIPDNAALFGLSKVVHLELPGIFLRGIDLDDYTTAQDIWEEINHMKGERQIAYRNKERYEEGFTAFDLEQEEDQKISYENGKVYLITGGMGGIGLEIAKNLAVKANVTIVLIGRTPLPPRDTWDSNSTLDNNSKVKKCMETIKQIEAAGSEVTYYHSDLYDYEKMQAVIEDIRQKYGEINGVFHCAGVASGGVLIRRKLQEVYEVFKPKIFGTWILGQLIPDAYLDFFVLFSSGQSILSEPGNGDYTAANAYLDAYGEHRAYLGKKALAIDWVSWSETGMSVEHGFNKDTIFKALKTKDALNMLEKAMSKKVNRLLIGQFNQAPEYLYMLDWAAFRLPDSIKSFAARHTKRKKTTQIPLVKDIKISLTGKDEDEMTEVEKVIAGIYYQVLGIEEININESFFELGGDSIMLNYMYTLINEKYPGGIKLIDVFTYTSIASMSKYISGKSTLKQSPVLEVKRDTIHNYTSIMEDLKRGEINLEDALKTIISE